MNASTTARTLREFNPNLNLLSTNPAEWTRLEAPMTHEDITCEIDMMRESVMSGRKHVEFMIARNVAWRTQMVEEGQVAAVRDLTTSIASETKFWLQTNAIYLRKIGQAERFLS